jgi:glycosyltransferase involved in cell wall biosynthesis
MSRMRILIVSQYFWPEDFRINDVVKSLVKKDIAVDVLTGKPNYPDGDIFIGYSAFGCLKETWSGADLFRVPLFPRGQSSAIRLAINYISFIFSGLFYGPFLLRNRKYDVVFVYAPSPILVAIPAIFIAWLKRKKIIVWVQDLWPQSLSATGYIRSNMSLQCIGLVVSWIYRHTDLLLVQSIAFKGAVSALAPGKTVVYYPNSVDSIFSRTPDLNNKQPVIEELETGFPVIFAGNVGAAQAVGCIVKAALILQKEPQIRFVIFGEGSKWLWLSDQIAEHGLTNIYLAGRFPVDAMPAYLQKAEVLLVSLSDQPIFALTVPNKIQAYMASGRPIVASLNGEGARLVVESGAGISSPAEDPEALSNAILSLYEMSAEERRQIGENGRKFYRNHFDHELLVDQLIVHLDECATEKGKL